MPRRLILGNLFLDVSVFWDHCLVTQLTCRENGERRSSMPDQNEAVIRPKLHHVNLKTTRLQEMVDWYREVVGAEVIFQFPGGAWLTTRPTIGSPCCTRRGSRMTPRSLPIQGYTTWLSSTTQWITSWRPTSGLRP